MAGARYKASLSRAKARFTPSPRNISPDALVRDAVDLAVFIQQRTLYILYKQAKKVNELTPIEVSWLRADYITRVHYTKLMKRVPEEYFSEVYTYLVDPDSQRKRVKTIFMAEKSKTLAP